MAAVIAHAMGKPVGNAADRPPRSSVWFRYPSPDPGGWQTTSRWTVEDLLDEGFEVYSPEHTQRLWPNQEI